MKGMLVDSRGDVTGDTCEHRATEQATRRPKGFTGKAIRLKKRTLAITGLPVTVVTHRKLKP